MNDSENIVDLEKLGEEIARAKEIFSDLKAVKKREKKAMERFRKRYGYDGKTK